MSAPYGERPEPAVPAAKDGTEISTAVLVIGALVALVAIGKGFSGGVSGGLSVKAG